MNLNGHHAYVVEGWRGEVEEGLLALVEAHLGVKARGNPDVRVEEYESFGVDDARALVFAQSRRAVGESDTGTGRKVFVLFCGRMTREAQNALLKVFEEPTAGTTFFLVVPSVETLLPTLRSRLLPLVVPRERSARGAADAAAFLASKPSERLALVAPILENKDHAAARALVDALERALYERRTRSESVSGEVATLAPAFRELLAARGNLATRAPSLKLILEHLALVVPTA